MPETTLSRAEMGPRGRRCASSIEAASRPILAIIKKDASENEKARACSGLLVDLNQEPLALLRGRKPLALTLVVDIPRSALERLLSGMENQIALAILLHDFQ
jgi:hypothetical protein